MAWYDVIDSTAMVTSPMRSGMLALYDRDMVIVVVFSFSIVTVFVSIIEVVAV